MTRDKDRVYDAFMALLRVRLGELLVEARILTREQLTEVLEQQKRDPRRLGTLLVASGLVTETQVTQILSQQLSVPWVSLHHIDFSRQLLDLVPRQLAEQFCLVPIFVRRVRGQGNTLYVAMDDPSDDAALGAVGQYAGLPVRAMIAPPSDIRSALSAYYGVPPSPSQAPAVARVEGEAPRDRQITEPSLDRFLDTGDSDATLESIPSAELASEPSLQLVSEPRLAMTSEPRLKISVPPPPAHDPSLPAVIEDIPDSSPHVDVRELAMPRPRRASQQRRLITLTLLDGTQVTLPAKRPRIAPKMAESPPSEGDALTARDIIQALRAKLHGQDSSEVLGDHGQWEALFSALLEVLMKKHVVADWEFIEELKRL